MTASKSRTGENEPLLADAPPRSTQTDSTFFQSPRVIISILISIIFVLKLGFFLLSLPMVRIMEDIICHHHYDQVNNGFLVGLEDDIDESLCKGKEVQNQLTLLLAGIQFLNAIPGLITLIPYGLLADRIGRKPVFGLAMLGMLLSLFWNIMILRFWRIFPIHLIWVSSVFLLIGGGEGTATTVFFAMTSDITTQANRANVFMLGVVSVLVSAVIGSFAAAALMPRSPWIPLMSGVFCLCLGPFLILLVPETSHLRVSTKSTLTSDSSSDRSSSSTKFDDSTFLAAVKSKTIASIKRMYLSTKVFHSLPIMLLLSTFIMTGFSNEGIGLCVRYVSNRFSWKLSEVGFVFSLRALENVIVLLAILPFLSHLLVEYFHLSAKTKDLALARVSIIVLAIGSLIIATSSTIKLTIIGLIIWTLGTGCGSFTRSFMTSLVDQQHVGRLHAAIAVVETSGVLAASPSLAALYALGLKWNGPWVGLPFFGLALISLISGLGVWCFGLFESTLIEEDDLTRAGDQESTVRNSASSASNGFRHDIRSLEFVG